MANAVNYTPTAGCISLSRRQSEDHKITQSSFPWDQSTYSAIVPLGPQYCDLMDTSPGPSNSLPSSNSKHYLSSWEPNLNRTLSLSVLSGDFENWMAGWDDPTDRTKLFVPEMDPNKLHSAQPLFNDGDDSFPFEVSMNDEPLFQSPQSLSETRDLPPHERVCSTPFSWELNKLDYRVSNAARLAILSPEEESRLLAIAMPTQTFPITPPLSLSPEPVDQRKSRKRKSSDTSESDSSYSPYIKDLSPHKSTHNVVEKRYRTRLNQKIALLRNSIPGILVPDKDNLYGEDPQEDLRGLSSTQKLNKAAILTKAVEYIDHLVKQNKCLSKENQDLKCALLPQNTCNGVA